MNKLKIENSSSIELLTAEEMKRIYGGSITSVKIYNCLCSNSVDNKENLSITGFKATSSEAAVNALKYGKCKDYYNVKCACVATIAGTSC